jgi:peptidoglycan L-alanyl-D-glutamate endopeptidase CwlK
MYRFGRRSLEIINGLHPDLQKVLLEAITSSPWDFGLHSGYRSPEEQYELYQQGRTKPGNKVTWIDGVSRKSYHNYNPALAFDFHCSVKGNTWDNTKKEVDGDPAYLEEIARHIVKVAKDKFDIELKWGGDWKKTPDAPHIQLPNKYVKEAQNK